MTAGRLRGGESPPRNNGMPGWRHGWAGRSTPSISRSSCLIMLPIAQEFNVPLTEVTAVFTLTLWLRLVGATAFGLARRSDRPQDAADDLDRLVLALQLHRRLLAHLRVPVLLPRAARHRHGCRMAGRRVAGDGDPGRSARAASWRACCRARGAWASCCRAPPMDCCTTTSAGAACCGSASCRRSRSSMCGSSSTSPRSGSRTAGSSGRSSARSACR